MPRVKEFDPDVALDRAMDLFWRQGYAGTSLTDLVAHLGIGRASLYATFGSKHELYVRALERYTRTRNPSLVEVLSQPGPVLPAVRALLEALLQPAGNDPEGCMIVDAAVERGAVDVEVRRCLETDWNAVAVALTSAFVRARAQGEVAAEHDPRTLAHLVLVVMQGVQVVGSCPDGRERARDAVEQTLAHVTAGGPAPQPAGPTAVTD